MIYDYETRKKIARHRNPKPQPARIDFTTGCSWALVVLLVTGALWMLWAFQVLTISS